MRRVCWTAFLVVATAGWSHAATVERVGVEDLVKRAQTIVSGKVTSARTYWTSDKKFILTDYTFQVEESFKGSSSRNISVTTIGGKIGAIELYVSGMPSFQKGETAVVFIESTGVYQTVLGLEQGKFTVANGEVANRVDGLSFPDGKRGSSIRMSLQTFKAQIHSLLSR